MISIVSTEWHGFLRLLTDSIPFRCGNKFAKKQLVVPGRIIVTGACWRLEPLYVIAHPLLIASMYEVVLIPLSSLRRTSIGSRPLYIYDAFPTIILRATEYLRSNHSDARPTAGSMVPDHLSEVYPKK